MKLGEWLKAEHQKRGLSWSEMEALTGVSTNALRNIENNPNARPGWDTVMKIADGLDAPRDVLFEMAGQPTHTDERIDYNTLYKPL